MICEIHKLISKIENEIKEWEIISVHDNLSFAINTFKDMIPNKPQSNIHNLQFELIRLIVIRYPESNNTVLLECMFIK